MIYRISLPGIATDITVAPDGVVIYSPLLTKAVGLKLTQVRRWVTRKGGTIREFDPEIRPGRRRLSATEREGVPWNN
jgi:hypothetical protein